MRFVYRLACFYALATAYGKVAAQSPLSGNAVIFTTGDETYAGDGNVLPSDSNHFYLIRNILITGNKKTNPNIILRELSFQINEEYPLDQISKRFQKARKQLMNTGLFSDVIVSLKSLSGYDVYVNIEVQEKWYIWPKPFIKPIDRNFHQWWSQTNRSMDRINYGLKLTHNNFTGRNDKLKVNLMNGYTKQVSVQYYGLYLDNKLRWSINGGVSVGKNREVNYMTVENRLVPIKGDDQFLRSYMSWFAEVSFRPAIKTKHTFGIAYNYEEFADTIFKLNPYFTSGKNIIRYPELSYKLSYVDVDFVPYPTKGHMAEIWLRKKGLTAPLNMWQMTVKGSASWPVAQNYFLNVRAVGMVKLPFKQPYVNRQFIGYEDQYLQGYEYYVIDGVAGGYTKASFAREIVNTHVRIPSKKIKCLNSIPLKMYAKTFVDVGYVYSDYRGQNALTNKLLYSGGVGLDIVAFTDFVIKLEWSFNRLGENGLYLHRRNYF